jgi:nucleotide-binding universal stress UspA family protein
MDTRFQNILVPMDFSPYARVALHYVADIAERFLSSIVVLHVMAKETDTGIIHRHMGPQSIALLGPETVPISPMRCWEAWPSGWCACRPTRC